MNSNLFDRASGAARPTVVLRAVASALMISTLILAGCSSDEKEKDKPATQAAARVNKAEITVHQINNVLRQQRGLPPAQAASASQQVLERLIDQEVAVQKAQELKLDREPGILQQVEAARREIIARAYVEKIGAGLLKPSADDVKKYYDAHPALFQDRRVYSFQELSIEATPAQVGELRAKLQAVQNGAEFVEFLKAGGYKYNVNQAVRAAEQLPLSSLNDFAKMTDGQAIFNAVPSGAQVVILAGSRSQPVGEEQARPAIEQFLLNERKRKLIEDDLKALRAAAQIDYLGEYVKPAAAPASASAPASAAAADALR